MCDFDFNQINNSAHLFFFLTFTQVWLLGTFYSPAACEVVRATQLHLKGSQAKKVENHCPKLQPRMWLTAFLLHAPIIRPINELSFAHSGEFHDIFWYNNNLTCSWRWFLQAVLAMLKEQFTPKWKKSAIIFSPSCRWRVRWSTNRFWSFTTKLCCSFLLNYWGGSRFVLKLKKKQQQNKT